MQTPYPRTNTTALWLAVVWVVLSGATPVIGQCLPDEVIKQVQVTEPANFDQAEPFRTNRAQINIGFQHDGASGSYLVNTAGADVNGSTFLPLPTDTSGQVGAGFNVDGIKQVGVIIFQQKCNVVVDSRQSPASGGPQVFIQFDTKAPVITIQSVTLGDATQNTPVPFNNQTFTTNQDQVTITGTVVDPDNGSPADQIQLTVRNRANNQTTTVTVDETGTFAAQVQLSGLEDGPVNLDITAQDTLTDTQATPNQSDPTTVLFVRDTTAPTVQQVEIIRFNDDPARRQVLPPGVKTFVGQETVFLRITMSEQMASPPQVNVTQNGGVAIPAVLRQEQTINNTIFVFQYSTIPVEAQNGPAQVQITGAFDGNQPNPDFGFDRANNPIAADDASATLASAFTVDSVAPDLNRLPTPRPPGQFVSQPRDGQVVGRAAFPFTIQVFVDDFNTSSETDTAKNFASGVNFANVANTSTPQGDQTTSLTIGLRGPAGDIPGAPSVSPPTGLFLNLADFTSAEDENANFTDRDGDGTKEPIDGTYTITVGLVDNVGNTAQRTITFTVDTIAVSAESIAVNLAGCVSLQTGEVPPIIASSQDPQFNVTATAVQFFSQIGGPNSVPVLFDADDPVRSAPANPGESSTITLNNVRKPGQTVAGDQFPNPTPAPPTPFVPPGSLDPRTGSNDGLHFVRVTPRDLAGNSGTVSTTNGRRQDFLDFPVQLDNTDPFTERTFPLADSPIAGPLNFLEAVVVDPAATNGNAGCGIDVAATNMVARIEAAYQPGRVDRSFIEDASGNIPSRIRGTIKFTHIPNSVDPTRNDFNPRDDRFRVALEFTDPVTGRSRTLPTDGSMDGIYSIAVNPTDRAGNSLDVDPLNPQRKGQYFGLQTSIDTTIDLAQFFFLVDNVPPKLELENFPDGVLLTGDPGRLPGVNGKAKTDSTPRAVGATGVTQGPLIGARPFRIIGFASDLSAQQGEVTGSQNSVHRGGAGIARVEYFLQIVDAQGQPIPGEAARDGDKEGEIIPGKSNPVIPLSTAVLDGIQIAANNPIRSTTNPLDAAFAGTLRERRKFTIDDLLPPEDQLLTPRANQIDDHYRLTIRAIDRAGNVTSESRRVTIDVNDVRPPQLTEPASNSFTRSRVVQFKWNNVTGVRKFRFTLNFPPGAPNRSLERIIQKPTAEDQTKNTVLLTLPTEGQYNWTVSSFDQVENEGKASQPFYFTLDTTAPEITGNKATVTGDVQPSGRTGVLAIGTFNVRLEFSEELQTAPGVSWMPADPSTAPIELTTQSFVGNVYEGQGRVPNDADPRLFDGRANLIVQNVVDRAGNRINGQNMATIDGFEVDTGPAFQARFFTSPLTEAEVTVVVLASEELQSPPRFTGLSGLEQITDQAYRIQSNPRAFFTTLKLRQPNATQNVSMTVSGTDLDGNVSRRNLSLSVTRLRAGQASTILSVDRAFSIQVPADALERDVNALVFPPAEFDLDTDTTIPGVAKSAMMGAGKVQGGQELIDLGPVHGVEPAGLTFGSPATVVSPLPRTHGVPQDRIGIYLRRGDHWSYLPGRRQGGRLHAAIDTLGPMRFMADVAPPRIAEMIPDDGEELELARPTIEATLVDTGSGVARDGVSLTIDGKTVPFQFDSENGKVFYTPDTDLSPGKHSVELTVSDQSGNEAEPMKIGLIAPDQFGFRSPVMAVPNPVRRLMASFAADLTQPGATAKVRIEIFDMSGERIRTLDMDGPFVGRRLSIPWDLGDEWGDFVANGVYLFRVKAHSTTGSKARSKGKIVILR